eukprot:UN33227
MVQGVLNIAFQFGGAIVGALLLDWTIDQKSNLGSNALQPGYEDEEKRAALAEFLMTFYCYLWYIKLQLIKRV